MKLCNFKFEGKHLKVSYRNLTDLLGRCFCPEQHLNKAEPTADHGEALVTRLEVLEVIHKCNAFFFSFLERGEGGLYLRDKIYFILFWLFFFGWAEEFLFCCVQPIIAVMHNN